MIIKILKHVLLSIIICSFEYAQNELYYVNERSIYLERNIINFGNNRALTDADNQFDLYDFYQSTLSLGNQLNDGNGDDEKMMPLRNFIDSHITKHKESNTLPNLNDLDEKTKKLIYELQKELEETKKEIDNIRNNELAIQPVQDKIIIKNDGNISVSEQDFKQLENEGNFLKIEDYNFEDEYNEIISSDIYKEIKDSKKAKKEFKKTFINMMIIMVGLAMAIASETWYLIFLYTPQMLSLAKSYWKEFKYRINKPKYPK
ncbi:fam-b protein [Plasmodium chabaudi chabaudi]|uniref:Fam-b protein n=1 Tax=Plasmodium chabaudi chabaudi TaxID=31271 RepID=A0A4V0KBE9_PLACU|nr:fam-b protein [Plasmodium chabaudi chabaudi]VTZ69940.1 fam-b protein [Plasmodium chabaudi chabaudi]|eukprot:XP_016652889.1 fam-b protein [Plasmodium chabaudi chabaudi]